MKTLKIIVFFTLLIPNLKANNIDSLKLLLKNNNLEDTTRVNILNKIAILYQDKGNDSCILFATKAIKISNKLNFYQGTGKALGALGNYYNSIGSYQKALANFINAFKLYKTNNDLHQMSNIMNSIGNTYVGIEEQDKAFDAYTKSYEIASIDSFKYMMGISSVGLGNIYQLKNNPNKALELFTRAKSYFINTNSSKYSLSVTYTLIGNILVDLEKFDEAFLNYNNAILELKELNNTYGIASTYNFVGQAYIKKNDLDNALIYFIKSYEIFKTRKAYDDLKDVSLNISNVYKQKNNLTGALEYFTFYNNYKDTIFNATKNKQLLEVEAKYESEKKQQEIEVQNLKLKEQNYQKNILYAGIILIILFLILLLNRYNVKKKANESLSIANNHLEQKNSIIEQKNTEITDSIRYAQRIQNAVLPTNIDMGEWLANSFILSKPKDIVSGDFYWTTSFNNNYYLAVCDSTGHGVPGSFMSLLNIRFLSEAIQEKRIEKPNEIFNYVRDRLINSISKDGQQDGFDGILLCYNSKSKQISYSAANNNPILISNKAVIELPKDKMPVGKGEKNDSFTLQTIEIKKEDTLYLYTDGYADQFGGPKGKKYMYKKLNELLLNINNLDINKQSEILNQELENWKGNLEQVDDILIIGIRI